MNQNLLGTIVIVLFSGLGFGIGYTYNKAPVHVDSYEREVNYHNVHHVEKHTTAVVLPDGTRNEESSEVTVDEHLSTPFQSNTMTHLVGAE